MCVALLDIERVTIIVIIVRILNQVVNAWLFCVVIVTTRLQAFKFVHRRRIHWKHLWMVVRDVLLGWHQCVSFLIQVIHYHAVWQWDIVIIASVVYLLCWCIYWVEMTLLVTIIFLNQAMILLPLRLIDVEWFLGTTVVLALWYHLLLLLDLPNTGCYKRFPDAWWSETFIDLTCWRICDRLQRDSVHTTSWVKVD